MKTVTQYSLIPNTAIYLGSEHGDGSMEECTADAIADDVDLLRPRRVLCCLHRREEALAHIVGETLAALRLVGIDPRDDEHREAAIHRPAHERFLRVEVEKDLDDAIAGPQRDQGQDL